jgi:hypothetical protein
MLIQQSSRLLLFTCLGAAISMASWCQDASTALTAPVAYVYVSRVSASGNTAVVNAYAASTTGRLTRVTGSPFKANDGVLSVNGNKLYGISESGTYLDGYSIASNGALTYLTSTDYAAYNPSNCGAAGWVFPDRTGADLYAMNFDGDCSDNTIQSFAVKANGELTFLGSVDGGAGSFFGVHLPLTFIGDNKFGYEAVNNGCFYYQMWGFQRANNGDLSNAGITGLPMPPPPPGYNIYIPMFSAADPAGSYLAVSMEAAVPPGCSSGVPIQVGSFTANANGNLSTTNTYENMPNTAFTAVNDMKISPAGTLLALAGTEGLQIFHFNGANPPTSYTGLLTAESISQMFWDDSNHLYAISQSAGTLHVFTITPSAASEAPGSPYTLNQPLYIAVQDK